MWQVANQRGYTCQGTWMWKAIWEVDVAVPIVDISAFNEDKWHLFSKKEKKKSDIKEVTNNIKHNNNCHSSSRRERHVWVTTVRTIEYLKYK